MNNEEHKALAECLQEPLDTDNGHYLAAQLSDRAAWQSRVSLAHRAAEEELSRVKGLTFDTSLSSEDKRKIDLIFKIRSEQRLVDELSDKADILKMHISLGQTLLRSIQGEQQAGLGTGLK